MKSKLIEHGLSVLIIGLLALCLVLLFNRTPATTAFASHLPKELTTTRQLPFDFAFFNHANAFECGLLADVLNCYYPDETAQNKSLTSAIIQYKQAAATKQLERADEYQRVSPRVIVRLVPQYLEFVLVYILVMALCFYGVQTIAVWRFCRQKTAPQRASPSRSLVQKLRTTAGTITVGIVSFILFCPAYVIAYCLRTELNTDTMLFMIVLCTISNGLLMIYSNKFYTFLIGESRKGYVETALVKNLNADYSPNTHSGISWRSIIRIRKHFDGHVFDQIFKNAAVQYLPTIKEQASFLITGMIITEMALNIHGNLCYELLRQMLYKNFGIVVVIIYAIFLLVKASELFSDWLRHTHNRRYGNHLS